MSEFSIVDKDAGQASSGGFCLGPLTIRGDYTKEYGSFLWRDTAGNQLDINIDTYNRDESIPLLTRIAGSGSLLNLFHIGHTVLRSGERTVSGMRAQEWLAWTNLGQDGDEKTFKFTTETMRGTGGKTTPSMHVTFDSAQKLPDGTDTKTNMSDHEALAVWDAIIWSIGPAK